MAIKKLCRPFQSEIFAKRAYRELMLLKHMQHENVSTCFSPSLLEHGGFLAAWEQILSGGVSFVVIEIVACGTCRQSWGLALPVVCAQLAPG